jgi:gliding motility-associated-like protein
MADVHAGVYRLVRTLETCGDTSYFNLSVKPTPVPKILEADTALCEHTSLKLLAEAIPSGNLFWLTPRAYPDDTVRAELIEISSAELTDDGWYVLVAELDGCVDSIRTHVRVDPRITNALLSFDKAYYCEGDTVVFSYLPADGTRYVLRFPSTRPDTISLGPTSTMRIDTIGLADADGLVVLEIERLTCSGEHSLQLDVRRRPRPQFTGNQPSYCEEGTIEIVATQESGVTYEWRTPFGTTTSGGLLLLPNAVPSYTGSYQLIASTPYCDAAVSLNIVVHPLPVADISGSRAFLCKGDTLRLTAHQPNVTYLWNTNATTSFIDITQGGTYSVVVTTEFNCSADASTTIEDRPKPVFALVGDTMICFGEEIRLIPVLEINDNGIVFSWIATEGGEIFGSPWDYFIDLTVAGLYTLTTELNECVWTSATRVQNRICGELEFPTGFRPASDFPVNQKFGAIRQLPKELMSFEMFIYDRWGKLMFHTQDMSEGWDGTYNGQECAPGTYVYRVIARDLVTDTPILKVGTVALIR